MNTPPCRDGDAATTGEPDTDASDRDITLVLRFGPAEGPHSLALYDIHVDGHSPRYAALVRAIDQLPVNDLGHRLFLADVALPPACGVGVWPCRLSRMPSQDEVCDLLDGLGQALDGAHPIAQIGLTEHHILDETEWHLLSLGHPWALFRIEAVDRLERAFQPLMADAALGLAAFVRITDDDVREALGRASTVNAFRFATETQFAIDPDSYERFTKQAIRISQISPGATVSLRNHTAFHGSRRAVSRLAMHVGLRFEDEDLVRAFAFT